MAITKKRVQFQMTANPKVTPVHLFSLIRLKPDCKMPLTTVEFSPFIPSQLGRSIIPVFNQDHCPSTPAFVLGFDQKSQAATIQAERHRFEARLRESLSMSESEQTVACLQSAAPLSNYCQICQEHFKNYQHHLSLKNHLLRIHHNQFNEDIQHLCSLAKQQNSRPSPTPKHHPIHKRPRTSSNRPLVSPKTTADSYPKRNQSATELGMSDCLTQQAMAFP